VQEREGEKEGGRGIRNVSERERKGRKRVVG
jgi:hypothetical protein